MDGQTYIALSGKWITQDWKHCDYAPSIELFSLLAHESSAKTYVTFLLGGSGDSRDLCIGWQKVARRYLGWHDMEVCQVKL